MCRGIKALSVLVATYYMGQSGTIRCLRLTLQQGLKTIKTTPLRFIRARQQNRARERDRGQGLTCSNPN